MAGFLDKGVKKVIIIGVNDDKERDTIANHIREQVKHYNGIKVQNGIDRVVIIFYEGSKDVAITI